MRGGNDTGFYLACTALLASLRGANPRVVMPERIPLSPGPANQHHPTSVTVDPGPTFPCPLVGREVFDGAGVKTVPDADHVWVDHTCSLVDAITQWESPRA